MLAELLAVVALLAVAVASAGAFFLAGPNAAVAIAARDVAAALLETQRLAAAADAATVVVASARPGFSLRVYRGLPGTPQFVPANGPTYDAAASIDETAAPLGAPTFAFAVDARGAVVGYVGLSDGGTPIAVPCPGSGAFAVALAAGGEHRVVPVPCAAAPNVVAPAPAQTAAPPPATPAPTAAPSLVCALDAPCPLPALPVAAAPTLPPAATPAPTPGSADAPTATPVPAPTQAPPTAPPPTAAPGPPPFAGSVTIQTLVQECPGGAGDCLDAALLEDDSQQTILGGPTVYYACNADPHSLGGMPRTMQNADTVPHEYVGSTVIASNLISKLLTSWDAIVPPGVTLVIADGGTGGC